jgi:hypothetical protein
MHHRLDRYRHDHDHDHIARGDTEQHVVRAEFSG